MMPEISFKPEVIFHIGGLEVTNSLFTSWIVVIVIVVLAIILGRKLKEVPDGRQNVVELAIEKLYGMVEGTAENKKLTKIFFPIVATFFIYIIIANWMEILPGFGTIGVHHGEHGLMPIFRAATTDLNFTLLLAMISVLTVQVVGVTSLGFSKYAKKFINFKDGFIGFFVGVLETISEISKVISFSFRLFGNIFAGEVLLIVITYLIPLVGPIPFLGLEIFVGFVQALVFSMLTLVFLKLATSSH